MLKASRVQWTVPATRDSDPPTQQISRALEPIVERQRITGRKGDDVVDAEDISFPTFDPLLEYGVLRGASHLGAGLARLEVRCTIDPADLGLYGLWFHLLPVP